MRYDRIPAVPSILLRFAELLGTTVDNHCLIIPSKFGEGYCKGFVLNEHISMIISNYELNNDVVVNNPQPNSGKRIIFFKFQHIVAQSKALVTHPSAPSVLIATSRINTDKVISIHSNTSTINIEIDADYLSRLFEYPENSPVLESLLQNTQPLLFEQLIYPSLQKIADELINEHTSATFELFFLRIKAEELICRLLMELEKREKKQLYPLNNRDIETIYKVRDEMLQNLQTPPLIQTLSASAGMSPTKLKRLFSQIFGDSIYSYFQTFRIKEAARLLKEEKLSVSAAGYQMGFTNLSHFSRVFEEHMGIKPKKYSAL